ncbi:MAG: prepilin-type N-terminal cleavage/methylation domain-containing protein [Oleiphilaceae bacterium]|jgi:prepilin-type N-terminal cleavage/methylation domain-containing protein
MRNIAINQKGFTLIELVMVIVLLGILSVGASGLFSSKSSYAEYIAKEQLIAQGLLAQQIAFGMSATSDPVSLSVARSASGQTSFSLSKVGQPALTELLDSSLNSPLVDGSALSNGTSVTFTWNSKAGLSDDTNHSVTFVGDKSYRVCFSSFGYVYESSVACP